MVCVFCFAISFPETDSNTLDAIDIASFPDNRIIAIAPAPEGVANATIVSWLIIYWGLPFDLCKDTKFK